MHEYSIIAALVERVGREIESRPGAVARKLHVRIGELSGVDPDLLSTAFTTFRARSACAEAELELVSVPAVWRCTRCDRSIAPGSVLRCPGCGRPARLTSGDDITLERIEMEIPDV
jgi:hydrogenase nickel incorporation protein HypA/HybF